MPHSNIDISQIPEVEVRNLSSTFLAAVIRYYDDPEHLKAFENWQRERKGQKNG